MPAMCGKENKSMNTIDYAKIDEQINKHVGIGKQFETAQKALELIRQKYKGSLM